MKFQLIPAKNQKFDIGRTINFAKCDCKECDFMHCPKNNYAVKMVQKKYTIKEYFEENKTEIMKRGHISDYFNYDTVADIFDSCISGFPKGTYWQPCGHEHVVSVSLCTQNRSRYGEDFIDKAEVDLQYKPFVVSCFTGCTDAQEKLANKISKIFQELAALFEEEQVTREKLEVNNGMQL